jgi:hypothetical protein
MDPSGALVWVWVGLDHMDPVQESVFPAFTFDTVPDGGKVIDPFHCNSIDIDGMNGNLLISARSMDSVFYIERSTGKVLWKMGGSPFTKDNAAFVPVADPFHRQHDARFQSGWTPTCYGGSGPISMFDDESAEPHVARAVVYDVHVGPREGGTDADCTAVADAGNAADAAPTRATISWQYAGTVNSVYMGSFRILADGSRVIDWGLRNSDGSTFTEVDVDGHDLLDFTFDPAVGNSSYRTIKVPITAFDLSVLRSTAGLPPYGTPIRTNTASGLGGDF